MSQDEMERASPGAANGSGSSSSDAEPAMVVTRSRRSNAGNWMRKLLDQEERPDEHQDAQDFYNNEHWAEDADDDEFGGADAVAPEDVALESSGDEDEDEGEQDDDDAGEKVLRKEERQQKLLQKRKRKDPFAQAALRQKKAKTTTPTESMPPPPRPKKKSERVSWLPEATEGPVRSSSRRLTVQNKQVLTQGLEEKERHRLHVLEVMKRAERRKEKDQPKPMTQQERLVEAARVEKRNSKTLSRWEESERLKAEENKARLEALKNRKLDGPFVRYYSGPSLWVNDKLKHVGKDSCKIEELDDEPPLANDTETSIVDAQPSASAEQGGQQASGASQMQSAVDVKPEVSATNAEQVERAEKPAGSLEQTQSLPSEVGQTSQPQPSEPQASGLDGSQTEPAETQQIRSQQDSLQPAPAQPTATQASQPHLSQTQPSETQPANPTAASAEMAPGQGHSIMFAPPQSAGGFLDGIFDWASMDAHQTNGAPAQRPPSAQSQLPLAATGPVSAQESSKPINADGHAETSQQVQSAVPVPPPPPRVVLRAVRNLITLQNFDSLRPRDKDALSRALFKWPAGMPIALPTRPPPGRGARNAHLPHRELCCITAQPARYRDPLTGLPYADAFAFRSIRRFVSGLGGGMGTARWSNLLGCFVGPRSEGRFAVAKGVPERFTGKKKEVEPEKTAEAVQEEQPNGQDVKMEGT
ncbi:YL1 nuclear [Lasiodiplodia theobromae]|uniref:Vacuolar protein sorting-associated protein 72-like protein n=1 Tax=Lasiodiplodia theobromae TaxID=45133 RepID=A0A5N5D0B9_9PEZI|nr:Vacuolar protein sorting-associated protein 72-like protein [Lasiodiplodia theobromae]KAF9638746.1 YL1 nuclear [Lasiodiplodia theobromae]